MHMKDGGKRPWPGWLLRMAAAAAAALAGNLLLRAVPWPGEVLAAYEAAIKPDPSRPYRLLALTLFAAPLWEELLFRSFLYGWLRHRSGFWLSAAVSSLAFGLYHGNWIQGTYAFALGMVLAWGYEGGGRRKYLMAVLMHWAANLAAAAAFGL